MKRSKVTAKTANLDEFDTLPDGIYLLFIDGELIYFGNIKGNDFEGYAKMYEDGNVLIYDGEFKNSKPDGKGISYYVNKGKIEYSGHFKNGLFDGKGTYFDWKNNSSIEGIFKKGALINKIDL